VTDVVLDSGPLTMWAEADRRLLAILEAAQRNGGVAFVPTLCLVESLTGSPVDANLNRRLKGARIVSLDESDARSAASRRAAVGGSDAADPAVVAIAAGLGAAIVTTDPEDIGALVEAGPPAVHVVDPRA
jgi:hypothetical protein